MNARTRVLITDDFAQEGIDILANKGGFELEIRPALSEEELAREITGFDGLIVRSTTKVTRNILEAAAQLRLIGRAGIGMDNIDVDFATRRGVLLVNSPEGNVISAAEHAMALIAACARNIAWADRLVRAKRWDRKLLTGVELKGRTLGVVGLGRVGMTVARLGASHGMRVIATDPYLAVERATEAGITLVDLEPLLREADIVTLHVPLNDRTKRLLGTSELALMKPTARLINTSRGGVVDEKALAAALRAKRLAGAALDVFEREPLGASEFLEIDTVVLTPHLGGLTEEAHKRIAEDIAEQFVQFFSHGRITSAVNAIATTDPRIRAFVDLSWVLGSFAAQLARGRVLRIALTCEGEIARTEVRALSVSALCGALRHFCTEAVNPVNAEWIAKERGIRTTEARSPEAHDFLSLVTVTLETDQGIRTVAGTVFQERHPRVVRIDGYRVEITPTRHLLLMISPDKPGQVGKYGTLLGAHGINIDHMAVGRKERGKPALVAIALDDPAPEPVLRELAEVCKPGEVFTISV